MCRCYLLMSGARLIQEQGMGWQRAEPMEKFVTEKGQGKEERKGKGREVGKDMHGGRSVKEQ